MASQIVTVQGDDWTQLSAAEKGCFENQAGATLLYWVSDVKPDAAQTVGHNLRHLGDVGFQVNTSLSMKVWGRTLSNAGNVIVTEY
ncbi:hypothetical protein TUM17387_04690 [Shewanella carassii]|uniref:Uncharacterized protein n=1 Tax=Shewanella algae TaxID=38313 RepID=A0A7T8IPR8_9GAMM|nr:hypothetical protein [Shewanella carassii]QQO84125.1 hypothetical protein D7032_13245 [Shewanella algae]BCV65110.1 hypothetical protein TUM17387_04690 [Shewanella carassii]